MTLTMSFIRKIPKSCIDFTKLPFIKKLTYDKMTDSYGCHMSTIGHAKNKKEFDLCELRIYNKPTLIDGPFKVHFFRKTTNKLNPYVFENFLDGAEIKSKHDLLIQKYFLELFETLVKKGAIKLEIPEKN